MTKINKTSFYKPFLSDNAIFYGKGMNTYYKSESNFFMANNAISLFLMKVSPFFKGRGALRQK